MDYLSEVNYNADMGLDTESSSDEYEAIYTYPLYSLATILLLSAIGLIAFRKKEFK